MFKHWLRKWFGSALHPKQKHHRYGSSDTRRPYAPRHSSSHRSGYGHGRQGHGYYKRKHHSSS